MRYKNITTHPERERAYAEGREAFNEHKGRGYNPHVASNLTFAVLWWHGWDTAEEESKGERSPLAAHDQNDPTKLRPALEKPVPENQTAKYDRRPDAAPKQTAKVLHVPSKAKL